MLETPGKRVCVFSGFGGLWGRFSDVQKDLIRENAPALAFLGGCFASRAIHKLGVQWGVIPAIVFVHTHFSSAISKAELSQLAQFVACNPLPLSLYQLRQAVALKEKIDTLESQVSNILRGEL